MLATASHHTIDPETNHIKYERNAPPQVKVENAKILVHVESPHHFNIFSESEAMVYRNTII